MRHALFWLQALNRHGEPAARARDTYCEERVESDVEPHE